MEKHAAAVWLQYFVYNLLKDSPYVTREGGDVNRSDRSSVGGFGSRGARCTCEWFTLTSYRDPSCSLSAANTS